MQYRWHLRLCIWLKTLMIAHMKNVKLLRRMSVSVYVQTSVRTYICYLDCQKLLAEHCKNHRIIVRYDLFRITVNSNMPECIHVTALKRVDKHWQPCTYLGYRTLNTDCLSVFWKNIYKRVFLHLHVNITIWVCNVPSIVSWFILEEIPNTGQFWTYCF